MSAYSSSSQDDAVYSSPGPQQYSLVTPGMMRDPRNLSQVSPGFIYVIFPKSNNAFCGSYIIHCFQRLSVSSFLRGLLPPILPATRCRSARSRMAVVLTTEFAERQRSAYSFLENPARQHPHGTASYREDLCILGLGRSHRTYDQCLGPLRQLQQPAERTARPHEKLSFQLRMPG